MEKSELGPKLEAGGRPVLHRTVQCKCFLIVVLTLQGGSTWPPDKGPTANQRDWVGGRGRKVEVGGFSVHIFI